MTVKEILERHGVHSDGLELDLLRYIFDPINKDECAAQPDVADRPSSNHAKGRTIQDRGDQLTAEAVCKEIIPCDTVEIECVGSKLFCIIGFNCNTKYDETGYWEKNGERYDFDYVERHVIASGDDEAELIESIRTYKKISDMTIAEFLSSTEARKILGNVLPVNSAVRQL